MKKPARKATVMALAAAATKKKAVAKTPSPDTSSQGTSPQGMSAQGMSAQDSGADVLDRLYAVVMERRTADPARSHSARLLSRGTAKVAQKFGEEAVECLIEAVAGNPAALVGESADVLYHLLVMWVASGVTPDQVWAELRRREGISGIDEKAARLLPVGTSKIP